MDGLDEVVGPPRPVGPLGIPDRIHGVCQQNGVPEPLDERSGNGVVGQQVRHGRGVRNVSQKGALPVRDHRRRNHVDHGHSQLNSHVSHAVRGQRLDDHQIEAGVCVAISQDVFHPVVVVHDVAEHSAQRGAHRQNGRWIGEIVQHLRQVHVQFNRERRRHIHLRVVLPVTVRERREHRDDVAAVRQRPEHGPHEVPVALARDRLHGQYPEAFRRRHRGPRADRRREYGQDGRARRRGVRRVRHFVMFAATRRLTVTNGKFAAKYEIATKIRRPN